MGDAGDGGVALGGCGGVARFRGEVAEGLNGGGIWDGGWWRHGWGFVFGVVVVTSWVLEDVDGGDLRVGNGL